MNGISVEEYRRRKRMREGVTAQQEEQKPHAEHNPAHQKTGRRPTCTCPKQEQQILDILALGKATTCMALSTRLHISETSTRVNLRRLKETGKIVCLGNRGYILASEEKDNHAH